MSPAHSRPFKILWITLQMVLATISPHPESTTAHFHSYVSEFQYVPRYHPSRNPRCNLQWDRRDDFYEGQSEDNDHRRSSRFEEPLVAQDHPWIEIRAVLVRCLKMRKEVGKAPQSTRDCSRKVIISMRINNVGKTNTREEFVLVDHVLDPIKMRKIRLRNPYVIKVRQEPLLHLYGLRFQGIVNAEATEEVINKQRVNFTGCNDALDNPTCGRMSINGESIPFSQGFCCSCEESRGVDAAVLRRAGSFHSTAKSNYRRRDGANSARNRSESTANLFDNPKAPRQVERGNEERSADVLANGGDARRVTSHDISAVNGPLGERVSSRQRSEEKEEEEALGNNSVRRPTQRPSSEGWIPRAVDADTLSPILKSVFFDPMQTRGKIEAYIDAVYEQAMKERATVKQQADERSGNTSDERDRAGNLSDSTDGSRESSRWITSDRRISDRPQPLIHGSPVASDPRNPIAILTKAEGERGLGKTGGDEENRNFLDPAKRDGSTNLSESADREEKERNRPDGATRLENTSDYTSTSPAIHSCRVMSRIPEKTQFSRRTEKTMLSHGDNALPDNGSLSATAEFLTTSTIPFRRASTQNVNCDVTSSPVKSSDFKDDALAPLSKIVITESRSSIRKEERQYGLKTVANNVNASIESTSNSSAAEVRNDNASEGRRRQHANVSTRITAAPALTRLRNLSSAGEVTRLGELSAPLAAARTADKSSTRIRESGTHVPSPASGIRREAAGNFAKLYENRDSHGIYNSPKQMLKAVNLKNSYKFWKPGRRKSRGSKGARKFRGGKGTGGSSELFDKSLFAGRGESRGKRASPDFKRARFGRGASKRVRHPRGRSRRQLRSEEDAHGRRSEKSTSQVEDSRRKIQAFVDYYARPAMTPPFQHKTPENEIYGGPKNQAILETGHSYGKVRPEESDDAFHGDANGKESSVDERIEDKFVRISNVLKEDSTGSEAVRETPGDFGAFTKSEVAKVGVPEIQDERTDDLFARRKDEPNDPVTIRDDEITHERNAGVIGSRQRSNASEIHFRATVESTMTSREVAEPTLARRDDEKAASLKPEKKLSAAVVDSPLSSPITREPDRHVSRKINRDKSRKPSHANDTALQRTSFFVQEFPLEVAPGKKVVDYPETFRDGQVGTSSGNWTSSKEATRFPGAASNRSEHERGGANAKFSELNNNSSRVIAGYSARPQGPTPYGLVELSSRGSITEPEEAPSRYEEGEDGSRCIGDALLGDLDGDQGNLRDGESSGRARRRKNEIAELVDRIARQYAAYTPTMPGMPTLHDITEAETLPPEVETTSGQLTTTLATTTEITDKDFRASIRPYKYATTPFSEEIHDEVSLDETTFVDETEATTIDRALAASKQSFRKSHALGIASEEKARRVPSETARSETRQRNTAKRLPIFRTKTIDAEEDAEDHPWHRTTEIVQRTISANGSESARKAEAGEEKQRNKSEVEYFQDISAAPRFSSTAISANRVAQTRSKRSSFIRESGDPLAFHHDDEERTEKNWQNGRAGLNRNVESPDAAGLTELRFEIGKRLAGGSDYPVNRKFFRHTRESQDEEHEVAPRDIATRDVGLRATNGIDERCFNLNAREKERNTRDGPKNLASSQLHYARNDGVSKSDEAVSAKNRADVTTSLAAPSSASAKITAPTRHFSGSVRRGMEADRSAQVDAEERAHGVRLTATFDEVAVVMREIANLSSGARSASANDLSMIGAEMSDGTSAGRARSPANRDKSRKTSDTVVRGAKLTTASDKDEARDRADLDIAARNRGKKIRSFPPDAERRREDARKINGNPADVRARRVPDGGEYLRRSGEQACGNVREIIGDIKRVQSPSTSGTGVEGSGIAASEERGSLRAAGSGPADWHRSGRRLLSSGKSSHTVDANDEYYEDDESEADGRNDPASDDKANAGSDDLSGLGDRPGPREYRDRRKLAVETNRSAGENIDAGGVAVEREERDGTVAAEDAAAIFDNAQAAGEEAISRSNEGEITNVSGRNSEGGTYDIVRESIDPAGYNNDKALRALFEKDKVFVDQNTADNNAPWRRRSFYESENALSNPQINEEVDGESFSLGDKDSDDDLRDEFLSVSRPTSTAFNTKETVKSIMTSHDRPIMGEALRNADLSRETPTPSDGSIKISLSGRIRVNGGFNQTPMLISFDAVPEEEGDAATTTLADEPSVLAGTSNSVAVAESAAINLPLDDRNAAFDLSSSIERANDAVYGSLSATSDESRALGKTNASEVAMESCAKFFDLARENGKEGRLTDGGSARIEKRLREEDNAGSRTAKQVFLTGYPRPSDEMDRTSSRRSDVTIDKSEPRSGAVNFPDVLGSVLVDSGDLGNRDTMIQESRRRVDAPSIDADRSDSTTVDGPNATVLHVVPLVRVKIEEPRVDHGASDGENATRAESSVYPGGDSRNATSGGCYVMPTTIRQLETSESKSPTASDQPDGEPARTSQPEAHEAATNNRKASVPKSPSSAKLQAAVSDTAVGYSTSETLPVERQMSCGKCDDRSADAVRARNMMAIVRFMMKLLKIVTEDEETCPRRARLGGTTIHVKNVVVNGAFRSENASSRRESSHVGKQKSAADGTTITTERTRQNFTTAVRRSTIAERNRAESLPPVDGGDDTFEPFTEASRDRSTAPALPISSGQVLKNDGLSTLFETSARTKVYISASTGAISTSTPRSFLFYEPGKSPRVDAPRKDTSVHPTGVKGESRVFFNDSGRDAGRTKFRSDYERPNRASSPWPTDRDTVDPRLRFGRYVVASATNSTRDNGRIEAASREDEYPTRNRSDDGGLRWSESSGLADDTVAPIPSRDTGVSRDASLGGATRRDKSALSRKSRTVSDRRAGAAARTKLLNSSVRGGTPGGGDWIGEHRVAARSPVDKKLQESRDAPGGTVGDGTSEKVAFRRVREMIDRPRDPNPGGDRDDPLKAEEHIADDGPRGFSSRGRINEGIANKRGRSCDRVMSHSASNKKRDVGENRDFRMGNRVFRKRQKVSSPTKPKKRKKKKEKERRKEKRKKGYQRTRDTWAIRNQRFKRRLLMAPLEEEPTYDAGDAAATLSRRYKIERQDAGGPPKFAGGNARRRGAGSRAVDGSEIDPGRAQIRGGQDCTGDGHPANIDAAKYLESAHCLRFSDLWYSVYQMEHPIIEHAVHLQVYEKRSLANGSTYWADLTGGSIVRLGTFNRHHTSGEDTIAFAYKEVKTPGPEELPNLDVAHDRLLVPSSVTSKGSEYPVEGEAASEYLVVPASSVNENGNECDKAGVGFAAFAGQPDRCGRVRGTCLKNQPQAYRRHDAEARAAGRPGCYFLSNFASVPREPIRYNANGSGSREFLALEYHSPHVSAIDIEIRASYNAALAGGSKPSGCISEVHVDGTALDHTVVTVVMTNRGAISAYYRPTIADCPAGLPESWVNATFPRKTIPPRRDRTVSLDLYGELPINEFYCSVRLLNRLGVPLATRWIKIRKMDRCSCALHCSCVCVGDARDSAGCRPMSPELYHAAGFRDPMPTATSERGRLSDATLNVLLFVVSLILLLLVIGFLKWLIGLYIPAVGRWGLDSLLESSGMPGYFERELKCKCTVRDEHGAPVHPDTRRRTVRICSRKAELFLNTVFFLSFPFAVCCRRLGKVFRLSARKRYSNESKISSTCGEDECPKMICVSTYGDSRGSRMEAEDTKYVMDELQRSEESLRNHSKSKRSRCAREYHSRH